MDKEKQRLEDFRANLEANRFYSVKENKNYSKVCPAQMSYADLQELSERRRKLGEAALLTESHVVANGNFLGD